MEWARREELPFPEFAAQAFAGLRVKGRRPPSRAEVLLRMRQEWPSLFEGRGDAGHVG